MKEQGSENIKLEECNGFCIKPESIVTSFESLLQNSKRKSRPVVLNWSLFRTQGTSISDWRYFSLSQLGECAIGIEGAESREAAKHPTIRSTAPTAENHPAPDSGHAQVDKLRSRHAFISGLLWFIRSSDHLVLEKII